MHTIKTIFCFCTLLLFASCCPMGQHTYKIQNATSEPIKVVAVINRFTNIDTIITFIGKDGTETIGIVDLGMPPKNEQPDSLYSFFVLAVYKQDTVKTKKDCHSAQYWKFTKDTKYFGTCTQTVTDADF